MAIVIPVAVQAMQIASLAGQVAQRKAQAARIGERILNEAVLMTNWNSAMSGSVIEGTREFRWSTRSELWAQSATNVVPKMPAGVGFSVNQQPQLNEYAVSQVPMNLVSVQVFYQVQEKEYSLRLSTLVSANQ